MVSGCSAIATLAADVDEARYTLRLVELVLSYQWGDRWNYTAEEYDQYLKGKNPHGLKAPAARKSAERGSKA
jgi:hypothetical protein